MEEKSKNTPKKKPWKPMEEKAKNIPKKKKKPFVSMEIAKVPLNQEQAVLSCCEQPARASWGVEHAPDLQCINLYCDPAVAWAAVSS